MAAPDVLAGVTSNDVHLELYNAESDNPQWNVTINAAPVASIALLNQDRPEEWRAHFVTQKYAEGVRAAFDNMEARELLENLNATFYASQIRDTTLVKDAEKRVRAKLEAGYRKKLAGLRSNMAGAIKLAIAGINKGFWRDVDNSLKASLFGYLEEEGVVRPDRVIEAAFKDGQDRFFDVVLAKANELLDKSPEVYKELSKAIAGSDNLTDDDEDLDDEEDGEETSASTLGAHLARHNVPISASATAVPDTLKEQLRSRMALGGASIHQRGQR
jgi:hypothetical protein